MDDAQTLDGVRGADTCTIVDGELVAPERAPATRGAALGRYLVIEQVGEGGMGVVLRAYDPKLHRELALKQLHRGALDSDGEARLMREAQAMAQLSHPNVVTIYDVERTDDGVVMAMEYAEGQTLARWMADGPRPWREVLERFEQAGRGLQAAHDAGLVHRDFKPSNAIVGPEGRVRVMDFGLARAERGLEPSRTTHDEGHDEGHAEGQAEGHAERVSDEPTGAGPDLEHSASGSLSMQLTQAGAVMGTPGYMAPEQHRGETADARSDQYAFCVSMWEALVGERPFHGDFRGIVLAKHQGPPPLPRGSKVPRHAHEALRRGLQPKAEDRWPSMRALLEELGRDPARRRRRWLRAGAWLGGAVGLGAVGLWAWPRSDARPCQDATAQLHGVWDDARRAEVEAALRGTATSYADGTVVRVTERLDAYAEAWAAMHAEACEATAVHRVQSDALLDLRMQCLRRQRLRLEATVDVLAHAGPEEAQTAVQQVTSLPPLDRCADAEALGAAVPPPEHPGAAEAVQGLRDALTRVAALTQAGRYDDARAALAPLLERTAAVEYPPVEAEVLMASANLAHLQGEYDRAVDEASVAYALALRAGADAVAADAAAMEMFVIGHRQAKVELGRAWATSALALAQRTDPTGVEEAMVINGLGVLAYHDGDFARATEHFEQALRMLEAATDEPDDRIATTLNHLGAMLDEQGRYAEAEPNFRRALEIQREVYGPGHPRPTISMDNLALCLQAQGRNDAARELHLEALELRSRGLAPDHPDTGLTRNNLGWDYMGMKDADTALEHFTRAQEIFEKAYGPDHPRVAMALESMALAEAQRGHHPQAEALHRRALEIRRKALGNDHPNVALSLSGLGSLAFEQGRHDEAIELLEQARAILTAREGAERYLGDVLTSLGQALLAVARHDEARVHLERALELRQAGGGFDPAVLAKLRLYLAQAAAGQGQREEAKAQIERGLEALDGREGESVDEARAAIEAWRREQP